MGSLYDTPIAALLKAVRLLKERFGLNRSVGAAVADDRREQRGKLSHLREVVLLLAAYSAYTLVRKVIVPGADETGVDNAGSVIALERYIGLSWEPWLQGVASNGGETTILVFNYVYILTFFPLILATAVVMYIVNRERYLYYRGMVLLSFAVALALFALYPLAPPRFMNIEGIVDTIAVYGPPWYAAWDVDLYYNSYAAMPSLHFGWALLLGIILWNTGPRILKLLGLLSPAIMFFAITITGNHYVVDAIGGSVMIGIALVLYPHIIRARPVSESPRADALA